MALVFYPNSDEVQRGVLEDRIEIFLESARNYKAAILDAIGVEGELNKFAIPRDQLVAYNWGELARMLRELRDLPEISKGDKIRKAALITKLAEVYEVLRGAKMPKLEAVRLALINEASQLQTS